MFNLPRIRIEVDRMKYQVEHLFAQHNDELEQIINKELEAAISNYPFEQQIHEIARDVISNAIEAALKDFFKYGKGSEIIEEQISKALESFYEK